MGLGSRRPVAVSPTADALPALLHPAGGTGPVEVVPPGDLPAEAAGEQRQAVARPDARGGGRAATRVRERLAGELDDLELHRSVDVKDRLASAVRVERAARSARLTDLEMRARLVRADMLHRTGDTADGVQLAIEVQRWAEAHGPRSLLARSHLILSTSFEIIGDTASCLDHALLAVELLEASTSIRTRGNFVMRLADALAMVHSYDAARQRYAEAARIFIAIRDEERHLSLLNNLAYAEHEAGEHQAAWRTAEQMRMIADRSGIPLNPEFLDTLARTQLAMGKYILAENALLAAMDMLDEQGDIQPLTPAQLLLSLAEVQRRQGRLAAAQDTLDRCLAICVERELARVRVDALREQAELHAANGRYQLAYRLHKNYHDEAVSLSTRQQEAMARTQQAMFETAEARIQARRFWEQARTDPLTGLKNRRFVDEELPRALLEHVHSGRPLSVAIIDADHFKRINDTLSHDVGDQVIRMVAQLLRAGVVDAPVSESPADLGFVARLGGEEFVLVLTGVDLDGATPLLDALRRCVADHEWGPLTGQLPVTVSVGVTMAAPGDTQASVLRRADRGLYAAKARGRNRVVAVGQPEDEAWDVLGLPAGGAADEEPPALPADGGAGAMVEILHTGSDTGSDTGGRADGTARRVATGRDGTDATITLWPRPDRVQSRSR